MKHLFALFLLLVFTATGFSQTNQSNTIYWKESEPLSIDDFTIVADSSSKIKDNNLAVTRTGITYAITSKPQSKIFEVKVYATMRKPNSFIRRNILDAPVASIDYLLNHEQKHFDISEIFAREAVKLLSAKRFTKNHVKQIGILMQALFKQSEAMQDLYDKETNNGANAVVQEEWDKKIEEHLKLLDSYKNKTIIKKVY